MTTDEYMDQYRQSKLTRYLWYFIMVMAFGTMVLALFAGQWRIALTEFIIGLFVMRINMFEKYVSECNEAKARKQRIDLTK